MSTRSHDSERDSTGWIANRGTWKQNHVDYRAALLLSTIASRRSNVLVLGQPLLFIIEQVGFFLLHLRAEHRHGLRMQVDDNTHERSLNRRDRTTNNCTVSGYATTQHSTQRAPAAFECKKRTSGSAVSFSPPPSSSMNSLKSTVPLPSASQNEMICRT